MARAQYKVLRSTRDLPPRRVITKIITADPFTLDLIATHNSIAFDVLIKNRDAVNASVIIDENVGYTLGTGETAQHSDIQTTQVQVTGITTGFVILHVLDLQLLKRLQAVEVE